MTETKPRRRRHTKPEPGTALVIRQAEERYGDKAVKLFREVIAPGAPDEHVALVFHYAKAMDLDPLRRQVMLLEMPRKNKEKSTPGNDVWEKTYTIVVGVHGLLGKVQRDRSYAGVASAAVYAGESLIIGADQSVEHRYDPTQRPKSDAANVPLGAWATVFRKLHGRVVPHTAWVPYAECVLTTWDKNTKPWKKVPRELWAKMPAWMTEKCALAAAIRKAFDDVVGGVHVPEEFGGRTLGDGSVEVDAVIPEAEEVPAEQAALPAAPAKVEEAFDPSQQLAGLRTRFLNLADEQGIRHKRDIVSRQLDNSIWIVDSEVLKAAGADGSLNLEAATFDQVTAALELVQSLNRAAEARGRR